MSERSQLQRSFARRLDDVVRRLASGNPIAAVKDDIEWLDSAAKVLALKPTRWTNDSLAAVLVALLCVTVASALWGTTLSRTNISLNVQSDSLRADIAKDWRFDPRISGEVVHLERVTSLQAPNLGIVVDNDQGDAWVRLQGGRIVLQSLHLPSGARFELGTSTDATSMFIGRAAFQGRITVLGKGHVAAGSSAGKATVSQDYDLSIPETIDFSVGAPQTVATSLTIHSRVSWQLGVSPFESLGFSNETSREPGMPTITSGVKGGQIRFNDAKWEPIDIRQTEVLSVRRIGTARCEATVRDGSISTTVNGVVGDVMMGELEAARRVAPSYLDYLYNRQSVGFFWGCAVFLWGCLWGLRKTLFR